LSVCLRWSQVLCLFAGLASAVAGAPGLAQAPEASEEPFAERVEVEVVNVDVIVTDREKRRVLDLHEDDFELLVDGRPVPIEYFAAPRPPAVPAIAAESVAPLPVAASPLAEPIRPTNLILYIDQTALENRARHETLRELREFFATRAEGGDSVTVAVFEQNLRVLLLPTSDRGRIGQALEELENRPSLARLGNGERMQLQHDIRNYGRDAARFPPRFRLAEAQRLEHEIVAWAEQQLDRQQRSIAALAQMVDALAATEGRKVVVLATAGIQANPAVALLAALDQQRGVATTTDANRAPTLEGRGLELLTDFERMIQAAQNARIAFYTVAPGAEAPVENSAEFGSAGPNADRPLPRDFGAVEASSSIARMAGATGGATFTIGSDLDRRLEGVAADVDASYSLGFSTGAEAGDKDHRIEVRTRRAGLEVRHRESFRRRSAPDRAAASLAAAVTFGQAENPLEITLQLGAGKPDGKKKTGAIVPLAVGMPLRLLTLVPEAEVRRGKVSVRVAIQDARGRLLESPAAIVPIVVPEGQMQLALASSWYHRAEMRLAPGRQRVAVVVVDELSGLQSTAFVEIEIPAAD
jgi:VWFA-related protein